MTLVYACMYLLSHLIFIYAMHFCCFFFLLSTKSHTSCCCMHLSIIKNWRHRGEGGGNDIVNHIHAYIHTRTTGHITTGLDGISVEWPTCCAHFFIIRRLTRTQPNANYLLVLMLLRFCLLMMMSVIYFAYWSHQ